MASRRFVAAASAAALVAAGAFALHTTTATAEPSDFDLTRADLVDHADPAMVAAMTEHFDVGAAEVYDRLATDALAAELQDAAERELGDTYGGTWVSDDGIVVAVTDPSRAADVESMGATVAIVDAPLTELDADKALLDAADDVPDEVHGWSVDITGNTVAVTAESHEAAADFITSAGLSLDEVDIEIADERPAIAYEDLRGGEAYHIPAMGYRCSIGFSVWRPGNESGFVTAGHCGRTGQSTTAKGTALGVFQGSVFPGGDYAYVDTTWEWAGRPWVSQWNGTDAVVRNSNEAAVGAWVCRSGSTSGWRCGNILAKNVTVNYAEGTVRGMTRTSACADGGDSGGPFITGAGSAQGVTSGGSYGCSRPDVARSYFFPINPILNTYGLHLITG